MNRRTFLGAGGAALLGGTGGCRPPERAALPMVPDAAKETGSREADVVIIGGGTGGSAAALAACRRGATVILTEETDWLGGQLTSQAVPPDEHKWIESPLCGARSYYDLREGVRDYYRKNYPLVPGEMSNKVLNPGRGWVSRLCAEPSVWEKVLCGMLRPFVEKKLLTILYRTAPVSAEVDGDRVRSVTVSDAAGTKSSLVGKYFLDATEQGDLLPMAGCEFVTGAESQAETGEANAPNRADPKAIQSVTVCCALEYRPGEDHTIEKPAKYEFWKDYATRIDRERNRRLFGWDVAAGEGRYYDFDPTNRLKLRGPNFWTYRRIIDRSLFGDRYPGDISIINWHQNDYALGPLFGGTPEENAKHLEAARQMTLSLVYWLQKDTPRPDGNRTGWPELKLCGNVLGTADGLAKYPYIRESRRIRAEFTVLEQHVNADIRRKMGKSEAEPFPDSVGIGYYGIDIHACSNGDYARGYPSLNFRIPLGSLIPKRMENLLAAGKNIGVTHLTNGCYRLHPVEWSVGEAAGALAAYCVQKGDVPRRVRNTEKGLAAFQADLKAGGQQLEWNI